MMRAAVSRADGSRGSLSVPIARWPTGCEPPHVAADVLPRMNAERRGAEAGDQQLVVNVIASVKAGRAGPAEARALAVVARRLAARGADQVVAACTELMLAVDKGDLGLPVVDPARLLARRIVEIVTLDRSMARQLPAGSLLG
jgi:aspartate racemase